MRNMRAAGGAHAHEHAVCGKCGQAMQPWEKVFWVKGLRTRVKEQMGGRERAPAHEDVVAEVRAGVQRVIQQQRGALVRQADAQRGVQAREGHGSSAARLPAPTKPRLRRRLAARVVRVLRQD